MCALMQQGELGMRKGDSQSQLSGRLPWSSLSHYRFLYCKGVVVWQLHVFQVELEIGPAQQIHARCAAPC